MDKPEHIRAEIDDLRDDLEGALDLEERLDVALSIQTLQARHVKLTGREYPEPEPW